MLNKVKNFAISRILRHVANNAKLNAWTNWVAVAVAAAIGVGANWVLLFSYFGNHTPEGLTELVRVGSAVAVALALYFVGKFPGLKSLLPVVVGIVDEVDKQVRQKETDESVRVDGVTAKEETGACKQSLDQ